MPRLLKELHRQLEKSQESFFSVARSCQWSISKLVSCQQCSVSRQVLSEGVQRCCFIQAEKGTDSVSGTGTPASEPVME